MLKKHLSTAWSQNHSMLYSPRSVAYTLLYACQKNPELSVSDALATTKSFVQKKKQAHMLPAVYRELQNITHAKLRATQCTVIASDEYFYSLCDQSMLQSLLSTDDQLLPVYEQSNAVTGIVVEHAWRRVELTLESALRQIKKVLLSAESSLA